MSISSQSKLPAADLSYSSFLPPTNSTPRIQSLCWLIPGDYSIPCPFVSVTITVASHCRSNYLLLIYALQAQQPLTQMAAKINNLAGRFPVPRSRCFCCHYLYPYLASDLRATTFKWPTKLIDLPLKPIVCAGRPNEQQLIGNIAATS